WTPNAPGNKCTVPGQRYYIGVLNRVAATGGNFVLHLEDTGSDRPTYDPLKEGVGRLNTPLPPVACRGERPAWREPLGLAGTGAVTQVGQKLVNRPRATSVPSWHATPRSWHAMARCRRKSWHVYAASRGARGVACVMAPSPRSTSPVLAAMVEAMSVQRLVAVLHALGLTPVSSRTPSRATMIDRLLTDD